MEKICWDGSRGEGDHDVDVWFWIKPRTLERSLPWTLLKGCMDGHHQCVTFMPEDVWFLELPEWSVIKPSLQSGRKPVSVEKCPLDRPPAHHREGTHIFFSSDCGMKPEYPEKTHTVTRSTWSLQLWATLIHATPSENWYTLLFLWYFSFEVFFHLDSRNLQLDRWRRYSLKQCANHCTGIEILGDGGRRCLDKDNSCIFQKVFTAGKQLLWQRECSLHRSIIRRGQVLMNMPWKMQQKITSWNLYVIVRHQGPIVRLIMISLLLHIDKEECVSANSGWRLQGC